MICKLLSSFLCTGCCTAVRQAGEAGMGLLKVILNLQTREAAQHSGKGKDPGSRPPGFESHLRPIPAGPLCFSFLIYKIEY